MLRTTLLTVLACGASLASAESITGIYTDQAAWQGAITGPTLTQPFTDGSTQGVNVFSCYGYPSNNCIFLRSPSIPNDVATLSSGVLIDSVGRLASNPVSGINGEYHYTTLGLPPAQQASALSFHINASASNQYDGSTGAFALSVYTFDGGLQTIYPFGGNGPQDYSPSAAYDGFMGFTFYNPVVAFGFAGGDTLYELSDVTVAELAPEPSTFGIAGLGIALVGLALRKRKAH